MNNIYSNIKKLNSKIQLKVIHILNNDGLIALPTETVYGLAGNAYSDYACRKIFRLKKRPKFNPLIVHYYNYNNLKKSQLELEYAKYELTKLEQEVILSAATAYYNLGYNFKNLEFNQLNIELFERQVESDRSRLERGEISLTDFAQSESSLAAAQAKFITARNELISGKKNFQKIIGSKSPEEINLSFIPKLTTPTSLRTASAISDQINPRLNLAIHLKYQSL